MKSTLVSELLQIVEEASDRLSDVTDAEAALKPAPEKWSNKEILGHLLDSAANNHHSCVAFLSITPKCSNFSPKHLSVPAKNPWRSPSQASAGTRVGTVFNRTAIGSVSQFASIMGIQPR